MPPFLAGLIVFLTSGAVLVMEILAGRLLAPYVGVSLETYTGIIGVVLAGIALGAWWGGRLADRIDPRRILGPLIIAGGAFALLTVPAVTLVGQVPLGGGPLAIVALSVVGFFAPAVVLSAVPPAVVKLQLASLSRTGRVVGQLSAIGTAGAILGTFSTGFVLIAAFPTRPILLALGTALIAGGTGLWLALRAAGDRRDRAGAAALLLAVVAGSLALIGATKCDFESPYFCGHIEVDPLRPSGRVLWLDTLRHSYVDLEDPTHLEFAYVQLIADALNAHAAPGQPIDALHLGGGGFTLPRYVRDTRPGSTSVVLEIDPVLVEVAQRDLGLRLGDDLRVEVGDARLRLDLVAPESMDFAVGDAFGGRAVPWHLATFEFAEKVQRVLRPEGVYAMNVIDSPPMAFARAQAATARAAFAHVALLALPERAEGRDGGNVVLVASDAPLALEALAAEIARRGGEELVVSGGTLDAFIGAAPVLTDDYAPVDQLLSPRR